MRKLRIVKVHGMLMISDIFIIIDKAQTQHYFVTTPSAES